MRHSRSIYRPTYDALSTDDQLLQFRLQVRPNLIFYEAFYHFPTIFKSPMFPTFANSHRHFATPFSLRSTRHHLCFDSKIAFFQRLVVEILNLASAYCLFRALGSQCDISATSSSIPMVFQAIHFHFSTSFQSQQSLLSPTTSSKVGHIGIYLIYNSEYERHFK